MIVETAQLDAVRARVARLARVDTTGLLERLAAQLREQTTTRVARQASPDGAAWAPWSARYAVTRRAGHALLRDTGALASSILGFVDGGAATVGSPLPYASATLARPWLGLGPQDRDALERIAAGFVTEALDA